MKGGKLLDDPDGAPYLAMCPWDVEVWFASDSFNGLPTIAQGPYLNLCFRAFQRQPFCTLPDDDSRLWKLAGCASIEEWQGLRGTVFGAGGWTLTEEGWSHPTVTSVYGSSIDRHARAVKAGRIAGKASARVRREMAKRKRDGTIVQRPSTKGRSTIVNPPSPSPSPSPSPEERTSALARGDSPPIAWSREACDAWIERFGGTAPGGQIGKALKPLVDRHGWEIVRQAWCSYLRQVEPEYASASRFASTFGRWSGTAPPGAKSTVTERTVANLEAWVAGKEGGS